MSRSILLMSLLGVCLMSNDLLMAQEELTESSTELAATSAPAEADSFYIFCDFDLENIENLLTYLPDICADIYYNRTDNNLYDLYLEEAKNFGKFYKKLNDYELRNKTNGDKEELTKYPFDRKLRNDTYNKINWNQCSTTANSTIIDYLNCVKRKRLELAELIPSLAGEK